jgi:hypothetical protein
MLIDLRKTKITFIRQEENRPRSFQEKIAEGDKIIATPVAVLGSTGKMREAHLQDLARLQMHEEEIGATPVKVFPI